MGERQDLSGGQIGSALRRFDHHAVFHAMRPHRLPTAVEHAGRLDAVEAVAAPDFHRVMDIVKQTDRSQLQAYLHLGFHHQPGAVAYEGQVMPAKGGSLAMDFESQHARSRQSRRGRPDGGAKAEAPAANPAASTPRRFNRFGASIIRLTQPARPDQITRARIFWISVVGRRNSQHPRAMRHCTKSD